MGDAQVKFTAERAGHPDALGQPDGRPARRRAPPPLHPGTQEPAGPDDLSPIFPMSLILQEVSAEPRDRDPRAGARGLQAVAADARCSGRGGWSASSIRPAHIYYKYEGGSPPGSHKANTAVAQAYENAAAGIKKLTTETGAGQWGSALAFACQLFGLECEVWMVGSSYDQKPYRRSMMRDLGRDRAPLAVGPDRSRARPERAHHRLAGDRHLRGGRGGRPEPRHQLLAGLGAQPRAAAPDGDRPGGDGPDGDGRRVPGHRDRAASAAARTSAG